jgi:addiction module RelE/StbE family toxin
MPESIYWSPKAIEHLRGIRDYISKDSIVYSKNVISQILQKVEAIGKSPLSGRNVPEYKQTNLRERRYGNYRIVYRVQPDKIEIAAIFHTAQLLTDLD